MKIFKQLYNRFEFVRYKILKKDNIVSSLYRNIVRFLYPIFGSKYLLNSRLVNYRNRESKKLYQLVIEYSKNDENLKKDLVLCYYFYHILPWEYKLYNFHNQSHTERLCWLSDTDRYMICELLMGNEPYKVLKDKSKFYNLLKPFFKRSIFHFNGFTIEDEFNKFITTNKCDLFVKPLEGSLGRDTFKVSTIFERENLFNFLSNSNKNWLIEGAIIQSSQMAKWNFSSVNTVRIPSLRVNNKWHILQPFFRTGRAGQIVDNAGAGGILCVVDENTGSIISHGYDEYSNVYEAHPDSNIPYKGWKLPEFDKLLSLVKEIHEKLPSTFMYVGFDFAHTDNGWDLIEGNWGQFVGQIAAQRGIKHEFDNYLCI